MQTDQLSKHGTPILVIISDEVIKICVRLMGRSGALAEVTMSWKKPSNLETGQHIQFRDYIFTRNVSHFVLYNQTLHWSLETIVSLGVPELCNSFLQSLINLALLFLLHYLSIKIWVVCLLALTHLWLVSVYYYQWCSGI